MSREKANSSFASIFLGFLAALGSSLCCITPVLGMLAGVSGIASSFAWLEPFRPYLYGIAIVSLAFAWYWEWRTQKGLKKACENGECSPRTLKKRRIWLTIFTMVALLMITFPLYSGVLLKENPKKELPPNKQGMAIERTIPVEGMTCAGCEKAIHHALAKKKGVVEVNADHEKGIAHVKFVPDEIELPDLKRVIEEEVGYKVVEKKTEDHE